MPGLLPVEIQQQAQADPRNYGVSHPYIGHLHKPNQALIIEGRDFRAVHHTDGHGFRNPWPWPEEAEIVALGDSLTFGYGVEDEQAWPAILARALPRSRVINLGLSGAGPQQYLRVYETFGVKLHPKVLLIGLFVRNDFWDTDLFDRWARSGAGGSYMVWRDFGRPERVGLSLRHPVTSIKRTLRWNAYLLARKTYLGNLLHEAWMMGKRRQLTEAQIVHMADGARLQLMPGDFVSKTAGAQPDRREFQLVIQALQRIQSIALEHDTHTLVVLQPSKEEVYASLAGEPPPDPSGPLRKALEGLGMAYLDLTLAFRQHAAAGEQLFFEVDGHPNAAGYALIAEVVRSHLQDNVERYALQESKVDFSQTKP
jgi:hypothetical protein